MQSNAPPPGAYTPGTKLVVGSHNVVIKSYISQGGFAHVYVVNISPPSLEGSIACLKRVVVPDKIYLNLLRAEVDAMKRLRGHPNIVRYIDSHAARMSANPDKSHHHHGSQEQQQSQQHIYEVFLLMEYCSGHGLIDYMNQHLQDMLTESNILKIMTDVTYGLSCMHYLQPPLIHRDLKIENILLTGDGTCKLCDFGSVSPVLRPPRNSAEFHILEEDIQCHTTAQYRAPEMVDIYRGFPINEKSDMWALGVFLYKLCYYTTPFEKEGQLAILHARYTFPPKPVYSDRLKNIIVALLQEDPRARPNVYQVLKEVCAMRGLEVPIKDIYSHPLPIPPPQQQQPAYPPSTFAASQPAAGLVRVEEARIQPKPEIPLVSPMYRGRPNKMLNASSKSLPDLVKIDADEADPGAHISELSASKTAANAIHGDPFEMLDQQNTAESVDLGHITPGSEAIQVLYENENPKTVEFNKEQRRDEEEDDISARFPSLEELEIALPRAVAAHPSLPAAVSMSTSSPVPGVSSALNTKLEKKEEKNDSLIDFEERRSEMEQQLIDLEEKEQEPEVVPRPPQPLPKPAQLREEVPTGEIEPNFKSLPTVVPHSRQSDRRTQREAHKPKPLELPQKPSIPRPSPSVTTDAPQIQRSLPTKSIQPIPIRRQPYPKYSADRTSESPVSQPVPPLVPKRKDIPASVKPSLPKRPVFESDPRRHSMGSNSTSSANSSFESSPGSPLEAELGTASGVPTSHPNHPYNKQPPKPPRRTRPVSMYMRSTSAEFFNDNVSMGKEPYGGKDLNERKELAKDFGEPLHRQRSERIESQRSGNGSAAANNELKRILTGISNSHNMVLVDLDTQHIDSNVDFLKTLDSESNLYGGSGEKGNNNNVSGDNGRSLLGHGLSSSKPKHSKKSSISLLPRLKKSSKESNSGPADSSDSVYSEDEPDTDEYTRRHNHGYHHHHNYHQPQNQQSVHRTFPRRVKTAFIQNRMQQFLERKNSPPPRRTAVGYGKYTEEYKHENLDRGGESDKDMDREREGSYDHTILTAPRKSGEGRRSFDFSATERRSFEDSVKERKSIERDIVKSLKHKEPRAVKPGPPPPLPEKPIHLQRSGTGNARRKSKDEWESQFNSKYPSLS